MSKSGIGQSDTKWLKRAGEMTDPCSTYPLSHLAGRRVVLLIKTRGLPAAKVRHKPPPQVVSEVGVVDHLDNEAVRCPA